MKQITISLNNQSCDTHRETRKMCVSSRERPFAVKRSSRREREFVWVFWFVFFFFLTGINRALKAAFLNRTPKEKLANEAAAGGEGPPHTPALGATPSPGPAAGKPGEAI